MHDVIEDRIPPYRRPYLISRVDDRIGTKEVFFDPDKVIAIVESTYPDSGRELSKPDEKSRKIAQHILNFFEMETKAGRLPRNLLPLQSGVGNVAAAIVAGLIEGPFRNLTFWTEVMQDSLMDFIDSGKLDFVTSAALSLSPGHAKKFYENLKFYKDKVLTENFFLLIRKRFV